MRILLAVAILSAFMPAFASEAGKGELPGRLKFKKGPVCMCSDGLSEKDIRAAEERRDSTGNGAIDELVEQLKTIRRGEKEEQ